MSLVQDMQARYLTDQGFLEILGQNEICVLTDFLDHREVADAFWSTFYPGDLPREVICGLNPGRLGAGLTGVPFTDFLSLSKLLPGIKRNDTEASAQFFFQVVQAVGAEAFFKRFYVTNISAVGFLKAGKNLNYHDLPQGARGVVERNFNEEMQVVAPTRVIALGRHAYASVKKNLPSGVEVSYLAHPSWIMTYRRSEADAWVRRYIDALMR